MLKLRDACRKAGLGGRAVWQAFWRPLERAGHFLVVTFPAGLARRVWRMYTEEDPVITANRLRSFERLNGLHCEFLETLRTEAWSTQNSRLDALLDRHQRDRVEVLVTVADHKHYDCHFPTMDWEYWWRRMSAMPVQPCRVCGHMFWAGFPRLGRVNGRWQWTWLGGWNDYCCESCKNADL